MIDLIKFINKNKTEFFTLAFNENEAKLVLKDTLPKLSEKELNYLYFLLKDFSQKNLSLPIPATTFHLNNINNKFYNYINYLIELKQLAE